MATAVDYPPFQHVAPTKMDIPFMNLGQIDLSKYEEGPEGLPARQALAAELEEACRTQGFFYIINHGFPQEKLDRLMAISAAILDLPQETKDKYLAGSKVSDGDDLENKENAGAERSPGFKARGYWAMQNGVRDNIEHHNWVNLLHESLLHKYEYAPIARDHLDEAKEYFNYLYFNVLRKLCTLFDIILELEDGTVWSVFEVHEGQPAISGNSYPRAMMYYGMSPEELKKTSQEWLRGHSDGSGLTLLTSQPMASLQFRDYHDGQWKYVAHIPGALVTNIGDLLEFLTGGFFKSTIHRVVEPPADQTGHKRLSLICFCDPAKQTIIDPSTFNSPKLKRLGYHEHPEWEKMVVSDWTPTKGKSFGKVQLNVGTGTEPDQYLIGGRLSERWHQKA